MDFLHYRKLFPVQNNAVYLNNAAESPLNVRVRERLESYLTLASDEPHKKPPVRQPVREALAGFFGGNTGDYALVTSTGIGVGIVASGFQWEKGDNMVVPVDEHWNNTFPWLALRERGIDVRLVPVDDDERVDSEKIAGFIDSKTRILSTAAVRFNTGFRANLRQLSSIAHEKGALFMVDGIQGAGVYPINMIEDGIDIFACAGFKWLLGMPGTGFLYMNRAAQERIAPVLPGMFAAGSDTRAIHYHPDARKYETGTMAYANFYAWMAGLELLQEIGIENIHTRVLKLTDRIIDGLNSAKITIRTPVDVLEERSAIISFLVGDEDHNKKIVGKLKSRNILVALRDGCIRVSPNFFNSEEEIDRFLEIL